MRFSSLACVALSIAAANAAPSRLRDRVARRAARSRGSQPMIALESVEQTNDKNTQYSQNWSGAVLESPPSGIFTSAKGTFTVPTPQYVGNGGGSESSSAWVGIDGDTCSSAILQSGVDFTVDDSGNVSYDSWYEWYPDYAYDFDNFQVNSGDVIEVDIVASSTSKGKVTLINHTSGQSVSKTLSAPDSSSTLCGQNAEWIVEDFEQGGSLVALSNFGTVTFTDATAGTSTGSSAGLSGATVIDIKQNGTVYTDVSIDSDSQVTVTFSQQ